MLWLSMGAFAASVRLGYIYDQSSASWVVESFSQFKLGVKAVNDAGVLGGGYRLNYSVCNSEGEALVALRCAASLLDDPDVIGIVGTGYSSAAPLAASFSSIRQKPMVSPGSNLITLA
ncbi:hypothetical protein AB1Y20_000201 [Prymnesium parvum]|uniref:Receptor ligand binding region domain-containing protein n=1 Tax=Prymnesium parvum TaxID=97485 RepID=A0AB34K8P6_PRYPA